MPRPRRLLAVLALAVAVVAFPLGALASHQFADVPDSNPFHGDISAIADAGVTFGCGGGNYCPSANVTREQMAAFMNRLGALSAGKTPVVNADKLDGLDSTDFMPSGEMVISQYGPLQVTGGFTATIDNYFNFVRVTSTDDLFVQMPLTKPVSVGTQAYALASVDVCFASSVNLSIDQTTVNYAQDQTNGTILDDSTSNSTLGGGCYSAEAGTPAAVAGGLSLSLWLNFSAASIFNLTEVITHWVPV